MECDFSSVVAPHEGVPAEARRAVELALAEARADDLRRAAARGRALEAARRAHRRATRELLGAEKLRAYRAAVDDLKARWAETLHPPRGPRLSTEEYARLLARRRREGRALVRRLRLPAGRLEALARRTSARALQAVRPAPERRARGARASALVAEEEVPRDVRENAGNPWTIRTSPYPGSSAWYEWYPYGDFYKGTTNHTNPAVGQVGNRNRLSIHDASDIDIGSSYFSTNVGFWYSMPKTGLLECWIRAQLGSGRHQCSLDDEWGWSDSTTRQWSWLTLRTWGPPNSTLRQALMSDWFEEGYSSGGWSVQFLTSGKFYWAHLFSDVVHAKGSWIYVDVGARTANYIYTNDVEVTSKLDFRWWFEKVYVDSTG